MPSPDYSFANLEAFAGQPLGATDWVRIDQDRIEAFADCTEDRQWIHVDPQRARAESAHGTTIAHGLLTLALLPHFSWEAGVQPAGVAQALNYGFDKVRFLAPVPAGARVRDAVQLAAVTRKGPGQALLQVRHTVEIEGSDKPALVAEALVLLVGADPSSGRAVQ